MDKQKLLHYMEVSHYVSAGLVFILCFVVAMLGILEVGDWLFGWKV